MMGLGTSPLPPQKYSEPSLSKLPKLRTRLKKLDKNLIPTCPVLSLKEENLYSDIAAVPQCILKEAC